MPHLNYKYAIFPTKPQVHHIEKQLDQCRRQWNHAVWLRKKLRHALNCFRIDFLLKTLLSAEKDNNQSNRRKAIARIGAERFTDVEAKHWPRLYDLSTIFGNTFEIASRHLDTDILVHDLEPMIRIEYTAFKMYWKTPETEREKRPPGRPVSMALLRAIGQYAGYEAKRNIDRRFPASHRLSRAQIRFGVSGSSKAKWTRACNPSADQRKRGNPGDPRSKRRTESYGYHQTRDVLRRTRKGWQVLLKGIPPGLGWVPIKLHRPLPDNASIKRMTVMRDRNTWAVVFTLDVSLETYRLPDADPDKAVGIDPGAETVLTMAIMNRKTGEHIFEKMDFRPLGDSLVKLEHLSQAISRHRGPDRRKGQSPSIRWKLLNKQRSRLHARIRHQRQDILHRVSRELASYGHIAIGNWEPVRKVKGRSEYKAGEADSVPQGPKGIKKARRSARDRSLATLRRLVDEKAIRTGAYADLKVNERYTTQTCSACDGRTGPKGDRSIREWTCSSCGIHHDRDENAALNILFRSLNAL